MKNRNLTKSIIEKGGLMIEALAMLGLIAVVTPTMYKKSAERTMEVEDINTATTVRTYMNAADSYMAANYSKLINEMEDGTSNEISMEELKKYLPYQYDTDSSLYNYETPKIKVVKSGSNLTAFALFPAVGDENTGLGQERTARIAALVGANGGYVTDSKTARGVGGVWNLSGEDYTKVFDSEDPHIYSLVTASNNVVNSVTAAAATENTKYLQRTKNDGETWPNAMRTDLYMGGGDDAADDPDDTNTDLHSIRNIESLIVGAEKAPDGSNYGLYMTGTKKDAYVEGTLKAAAGSLFVNPSTMVYGIPDENGKYVDSGRNKYSAITRISRRGDIENSGNTIYLGVIDTNRGVNIEAFGRQIKGGLFYGHKVNGSDTHPGTARVSLISEELFELGNGKLSSYDEYESNVIINRGSIGNNRVPGQPDKELNSAGGKLAPEYTEGKKPVFPARVGSNMMVDGLLAAGQVDAQHLRTASFSSGSEKLDDTHKWFNVDKDGVKIQDTDIDAVIGAGGTGGRNGTSVTVDRSGILMNTANAVPSNKAEFVVGRTNLDEYDNNNFIRGRAQRVLFQNDDVFFQIGSGKLEKDGTGLPLPGFGEATELGEKDIYFGSRDRDCVGSYEGRCEARSDAYRAIFGDGGTIDVIGSNFKVFKQGYGNNVFSVRAGAFNDLDDVERTQYRDAYIRSSGYNYDIAMHGAVVVTNGLQPDDDYAGAYISIGSSQGRLLAEQNVVPKAVSIRDYSNDSGQANGDTFAANIINIDTNKKYETELGLSFDDNIHAYRPAYVSPGRLVRPYYSYNIDGPNGDSNGIYIRKGAIAVGGFGAGNTTYITRGQIAISPTDPNYSNYTYSAANSKGTVLANRFVANNIKDGELIKVPEMIKDDVYKKYNGNTVRYDTYMVNPAYTSVMNDIKMVSRGGARLSDILPDFITKAIYVASNDKDESAFTNFSFTLNGNSGHGSSPLALANEPSSTDTYSWSSPYLGIVPAPQCPPGYGRVITVTPTSMQMAQAGQLYNDTSRKSRRLGKKLALSNSVIPPLETNKMIDLTKQAEYSQLEVAQNSGSGAASGFSMLDASLTKQDGTRAYVLATTQQNSRPLVFQQSTWLKAAVVPLVNGKSMKFGDKPGTNDYVRGWAVLMGFLYRSDEYANFLASSSANVGALVTPKDGKPGLYWNVFPVMKHTLEAIATTYCFFDRANMYGDYGDTKPIDKYDVLKDVGSSYEPISKSDTYRQRLNDPTLVYEELW